MREQVQDDQTNQQQETVQQKKQADQANQKKKPTQLKSEHTYQSKEGLKPPPPASYGKGIPIQTTQGQKGSYQSPQGKKPAVQAKQSPVQRSSTPVSKTQEIAHTMGQQYGVDTSGLNIKENSSFPSKVNAEATIQGNKIDFAPGKNTESNVKHEVGHYIINTQRGTPPKADKTVNGQAVNTTDEAAADRIAAAPLQRKCSSCEAGGMQHKKHNHGSAPLQRKCNACEQKKKKSPVQRKVVAPSLSTGLPLQRKCNACEQKKKKSPVQRKVVASSLTTDAPIQRHCPDCEAEEKLNGLNNNGGDKGKKDKGKKKEKTEDTTNKKAPIKEDTKTDTVDEKTENTPNDSGVPSGTVVKEPVKSESPKLDKGTNPVVDGLEQQAGMGGKNDKKEELHNKKKEDSKESKKENEKGKEKTKAKDGKDKKGGDEAGGKEKPKEESAGARLETVNARLEGNAQQLSSLSGTQISFNLPNTSNLSSDKMLELMNKQQQAGQVTASFFSEAAGHVDGLFSLAGLIRGRIMGAQSSIAAEMRNAAIAQQAAIVAKSQEAKAKAKAKAKGAKAKVNAQYLATTASIQVKTQAAKAKNEADYQGTLQALEDAKTKQASELDTVYAVADENYRQAGVSAGDMAIKEGEERATTYEKDKINEMDSLKDGYLTDRKAEARMKAAREVAKEFKAGLIKEANAQAVEAGKGKEKDLDILHETITKAKEHLKTHHDNISQGLDTQHAGAMAQALKAKNQSLEGIEQNLQTSLKSLDTQQKTQADAIEQGSQAQSAQLQKEAQLMAANMLDGLADLIGGLTQQLAELRNSLTGKEVPNPEALRGVLAGVNDGIAGAVGNAFGVLPEKVSQGEAAMQESLQGATKVLQTIGGNATKGITATLAQHDKGAASIAQSAHQSLQGIGKGYNTAADKLTKAGKSGFETIVKMVTENFTKLNTLRKEAFAQAVPNLAQGLLGALGGKGSTNEKEMHGLISKKATEAASKEQPAWKSIVKWVLIIAVVIVVALVVGPAVIGAVGAFATTMGAGAAAGVIGTVVGGAIVGAGTSVTIQLINNVAAGDPLFKDIGKAALTGAIGGAIGGGAGMIFEKLGATGVFKFVLESMVDVAADVAVKVKITGELDWEKIKSFDSEEWTKIGMGALQSVAMSGLTNGLTSTKFGKSATTHFQQKGTEFGTAVGVKMGGKVPPPKIDVAPPKTDTEVDTDAPKLPEVEVKTDTEAPKTPEVKKTETEVTKTPEVKKTETEVTKTPEVKKTESVDVRKEARGKNEVPDSGSNNKRSTHDNSPEIEKGGVVARHKTEDGHTVKVLTDGRVIICSVCGELRMNYAQELAASAHYRRKMSALEKIADPDIKAREATDLRQKLEGARTRREKKGTPTSKETGTVLAEKIGLPEAPKGYNWRRKADGSVGLVRASGNKHMPSPDAVARLLVKADLKALENGGVTQFVDADGRVIAEIDGGQLKFKYGGFGGDVVITPGKVTTVLGKFAETWTDPNSFGTRQFLGTNAKPVVKGFPDGSFSRGAGKADPDGMNFLDIPEPQYNALINKGIGEVLDGVLGTSSGLDFGSKNMAEVKSMIQKAHPSLTDAELKLVMDQGLNKGNNYFWDEYNLPFLEQSFIRGDDVRLVSDPKKHATGTYKRELDAIEGSFKDKYGYEYDASTKTYRKKTDPKGRVPKDKLGHGKDEIKLSDKHEIKYDKNGDAYLCSPFCTNIKEFTKRYGDKIKKEKWIQDRIDKIADLGDAVTIQKALEGLKTDIEHLNNYNFTPSKESSTSGTEHRRTSRSGRVIKEVQSENIRPATPPTDLPSTLDVSIIQHMQNSISNPTENYFVLYNAKLVKSGALELPPIKVWKNLDPDAPGIWTLDHRRLAAYQLAGVKEIKVEWASPKEVVGDSFKMGTTTKGKDLTVWVPVDPKTKKFTTFSKDKSSYDKEVWTIKNTDDGTAKLFDGKNREVNIDDIDKLLPDGYLKTEDSKSSESGNKDNTTLDGTTQMLSDVKQRTANDDGFEIRYTEKELQSIIQKGKDLGLDNDTIGDLIYIGSRNDVIERGQLVKKRLSSQELIGQMDNWVNIVKERGFPYRFDDLDAFNTFKSQLLGELASLGLSTTDVRLKGSAVRKPTAGDLDITVVLTQKEFNSLIVESYGANIKKNGEKIDISNMNDQELKILASEIDSDNSKAFNLGAKDFKEAILMGKILWLSEIPKFSKIQSELSKVYGEVDITIAKNDGNVSLKPYMKLKD